jgi:hypothetical protein
MRQDTDQQGARIRNDVHEEGRWIRNEGLEEEGTEEGIRIE